MNRTLKFFFYEHHLLGSDQARLLQPIWRLSRAEGVPRNVLHMPGRRSPTPVALHAVCDGRAVAEVAQAQRLCCFDLRRSLSGGLAGTLEHSKYRIRSKFSLRVLTRRCEQRTIPNRFI